MATTLLKVYTRRLFDALSRWHPRVELHVCVDDVDPCAAYRCPRQAADRLSGATRLLLQVFEGVLQLQVAYQKCVLLASSSNVDGRLRSNLRSTGIRLHSLGKKLGVQFSLRQRRRFGLLRQRAARARGRARRVAFLRRAAGPRARARLAATAITPVALYGGSCWGFPPSAVIQLRRLSITAVFNPSRFRSSSLPSFCGRAG